MSQCKICGSGAINLRSNGRDGSDPELCDVCYWKTRAEKYADALSLIRDPFASHPLFLTGISYERAYEEIAAEALKGVK